MGFDVTKNFGTDKNKEEQGVVIPLGEDSWIKVARMGGDNKKFAQIYAEGTKSYKVLGIEHMPQEQQKQVLIKCFAEAVVMDWHGIECNGEPLEYSVDNCKKLLSEVPEFFRWISNESSEISNFRLSIEDQEAKN